MLERISEIAETSCMSSPLLVSDFIGAMALTIMRFNLHAHADNPGNATYRGDLLSPPIFN